MTSSTVAGVGGEELARRHGLAPVGLRPGFGAYVRQVIDRRDFAWMLARSRVAARTEGDVLGAFWNILRPLMTAGVYLLVFGLILATGKSIPNFPVFLTIGVFVFTFTSSSINTGAKAITRNMNLVRALHFPRAVLPLATTLDELISMGPVLLVMFFLTVLVEAPSWAWLLVLPALVVQTAFNLGVTMVLARLTTRVRDVAQLLPFATRLWLYTSAVFYDASRWDNHGLLTVILDYNPAHLYIALFRGALMESQHITGAQWLGALAWAVVALVIGVVYFWRGEETYGRG